MPGAGSGTSSVAVGAVTGMPVQRLRRFLALTPGNPMNPGTLLVLVFFAGMLLGFPPFILVMGLGIGGIVLVTAVIVLTVVLCCGLVVAIARRYAGDADRLLAGDYWVHWRTNARERERFLAQEGERVRGEAGRYLWGASPVP